MSFNDDDLIQLLQVYHDDPIMFSEQILNIYPDDQQKAVILSVYDKKRTTVRSGRGCGKTWAAGIVIWHFLCTRAFSQIYISIRQFYYSFLKIFLDMLHLLIKFISCIYTFNII